MNKKLVILGSTGSIGQQTLDIVRAFPDRFQVIGLSGGVNIGLLTEQIAEFRPQLVYSESQLRLLDKVKLSSMEEMVSHREADIIVIATSGKTGLKPTIAAIRAGKQIALANKETLVMAGEIVMAEVRQCGVQIVPVDSEHSAIWQCIQGEESEVSQIILTASGGPFYGYSSTQLAEVTPEDTLKHPVWKMGKKVTVDSATLLNKGLEAMEAHWLFSIPMDKIKVLIHRQSVVHSLVEFIDGSLKAQLGSPDMHLPIQYALSYPERLSNPELPRLDLAGVSPLTFDSVDSETFPCLKLALEAGNRGETYPAVLCATDEVAVELFLAGHIGFTSIAKILAEVLSLHHGISNPTLDEILAADAWARETTLKVANRESLCY